MNNTISSDVPKRYHHEKPSDIQQDPHTMSDLMFVDDTYLIRIEPTKDTPLKRVEGKLQVGVSV